MKLQHVSKISQVLFLCFVINATFLHAETLPDLRVQGASVSTRFSSPGDYNNVIAVLENQGNSKRELTIE